MLILVELVLSLKQGFSSFLINVFVKQSLSVGDELHDGSTRAVMQYTQLLSLFKLRVQTAPSFGLVVVKFAQIALIELCVEFLKGMGMLVVASAFS